MMIDSPIACVLSLEQTVYGEGALPAIIEQILWRSSDYGVPPDMVALGADGVSPNYSALNRRQRLLSDRTLSRAQSVSLVRMAEGGHRVNIDWVWATRLSLWKKSTVIGVRDSDHRSREALLGDEMRSYIFDQLRPSYAYEFRQPMKSCPLMYASGGVVWGDRLSKLPDREGQTDTRWPKDRDRAVAGGVLRDLYPKNYLGPQALGAPMGFTGATLEQWIRSDSSHGSLSLSHVGLTLWAPPVSKIPELREHLYCHGRLYHWQLFDSTRVHYRSDLLAPWEEHRFVPEVYRASFYAEKDPGLVL